MCKILYLQGTLCIKIWEQTSEMGMFTIHDNNELNFLDTMLPNLMKPFKSNVIPPKNHVVGIHI